MPYNKGTNKEHQPKGQIKNMRNTVDTKLLKYLPKKNQKHIIELSREYGRISFAMEWEDGFSRSRMADNIAELKEMVATLEENREADF